LAIVSQIVKEHNGSIEVQNNRPNGAKFTVQIPA
jgi:two-component system nitrogen regulation sensor histidine kinase NtrY